MSDSEEGIGDLGSRSEIGTPDQLIVHSKFYAARAAKPKP
jgi:hypothetical protein